MEEQRFFADRLLTFLTSWEERREAEYEHLPWWEFVEAEGESEAYKRFYGIGPTRVLVAMQAEKSSTRSIGRIYVQLLLGIAMPWLHVDSVLDESDSHAFRPDVWPLEEPGVFELMKAYDRLRFEMGLPHRSLGTTTPSSR